MNKAEQDRLIEEVMDAVADFEKMNRSGLVCRWCGSTKKYRITGFQPTLVNGPHGQPVRQGKMIVCSWIEDAVGWVILAENANPKSISLCPECKKNFLGKLLPQTPGPEGKEDHP